MRRVPGGGDGEDFVPIPAGGELLAVCPPTLLCAEAGDMILYADKSSLNESCTGLAQIARLGPTL
jgi:hypothetical protein